MNPRRNPTGNSDGNASLPRLPHPWPTCDQNQLTQWIDEVLASEQVRRIVAKWTTALCRYADQEDREDAEQAIRLALILRLRKFDPARGPLPSFVSLIAKNHAKTWERDRRSQKRGWGRVKAFDPSLLEAIGGDRLRTSARLDLAELGLDAAEVLRDLPPIHRAVALRLCAGADIVAIASGMRVHRSVVGRIRRELKRRLFRLSNYVGTQNAPHAKQSFDRGPRGRHQANLAKVWTPENCGGAASAGVVSVHFEGEVHVYSLGERS